MMKRLLLILILTFSFQTLVKADDIGDFQIADMSIGDSLLSYFSNSEIQSYINEKSDVFVFKDGKYIIITAYADNPPYKKIKSDYDYVSVTIMPSDTKYKIHSITGTIRFKNNIEGCKFKKKEIEKSISSVFKNVKKESNNGNHSYDKTGNTKAYSTWFYANNGSISIHCEDWSNKLEIERGWHDRLKVEIQSKKFTNYLNASYK
jgi:hypothetical protein